MTNQIDPRPDYFTKLLEIQRMLIDYQSVLQALAAKLGRPNEPVTIATELESRAYKLRVKNPEAAGMLASLAEDIRNVRLATDSASHRATALLAGLETNSDTATDILEAA